MSRKQISKKARKVADTLFAHPEIVAFLFRQAATQRYTLAAVKTHEEYPTAGITEHYAREILRRAKPFDRAEMFSMVRDEDKVAVTSKFKGTVRPRKTKPVEETCPCSDTAILHEVLDARIAYQEVLDKAIDAGMKEESVIAWCEVVARGDLR
jgi:hypothetical protein